MDEWHPGIANNIQIALGLIDLNRQQICYSKRIFSVSQRSLSVHPLCAPFWLDDWFSATRHRPRFHSWPPPIASSLLQKLSSIFFLTKRQLFHPFANLVNTFRCCPTTRRRVWAMYIRSTERSKLDKLPKSPPQHRHFWPYSFSIWFYEKRKLLFHLKGYTYNMTFSADLTYEWNSIKLWKCKPGKSLSSNIFTDFTHAINALQWDYYQNIMNKI